MANPENKNLFFREGGTELHLNPRRFKAGLRELLQDQIFGKLPARIILVTGGKKRSFTPDFLRGVRDLSNDRRILFFDEKTYEMSNAEEIIILKGRDVSRNAGEKPHNSHTAVFKKFIERDPRFAQLDHWKG